MFRIDRLGCAFCPPNAVSPGGLSKKCTTCPRGFVSDGAECLCASNHFVGQKGYCEKCPKRRSRCTTLAKRCPICSNGK